MLRKLSVVIFVLMSLCPNQFVMADNSLSYWLDNESLNVGVSSKYGDVLFFWVDGASLEAGVVVPEPIDASLIFDFKLVQLGEDPKVLVDEQLRYDDLSESVFFYGETVWKVNIPTDVNASYRVGYTCYDQNGSLVYALVESVEMPIPELYLDLSAEKSVYYLFEPLRFALSNNGPDEMEYWNLRWYERLENGKWVHQPYISPPGIPAIGIILPPNSTHHIERHIPLTALFPGTYRICKDFYNGHITIVSGEFYYIGSIFYFIILLGIIYILHRRKSKALNKYVAIISLVIALYFIWMNIPSALERFNSFIWALSLAFFLIYAVILFFVVLNNHLTKTISPTGS